MHFSRSSHAKMRRYNKRFVPFSSTLASRNEVLFSTGFLGERKMWITFTLIILVADIIAVIKCIK